MEIRKSERIDMSKYVGAKKRNNESYKIMSAILQKHDKFGYGIKLETENIELTPEDSEKLKDVKASVIFKVGFDETKQELFIVEDSKFDKFLKTKKIDAERLPSDAKVGQELELFWGVPVVLMVKDNGYLTFL